MVADERLRAWVREDFGVELRAVERVDGGLDAAAAVWQAVAVDGARWAVKWSGGGSEAGLLLPALLARRGVPGVLAPRAGGAGSPWRERDGRRLSLTPWAPGTGALDDRDGMTPARWRSYGALLARVHATSAADAAAARLPREQHDHARWVAAVEEVERGLEVRGRRRRDTTTASSADDARAVADDARAVADGVRVAAAVGAPTGADPLVLALAETWDAAAARIAAVRTRADALAEDLRDRDAAYVACHGEPHLGNVLADGDDQAWLIDWDDALLAPRERDLLFAIGGVLSFAPVGAREQGWFFDGYGRTDVDPARLAYHRCVRALEDVSDLAADVLDVGRRGAEERAGALALLRGVLSETGLVRQALSEDAA